ncbi:MAG TPA: hypothetical protein PLP27_05810, partial [Crocinitomicaceae bacterium]|nr:hypothetical protein [Crocinitomicaceae bacterium]
MKNVYYLLIISLFACYDVSAQTSWGRVSNGQFTNEAMDVETDNAGNSYIAGYITGETAFGTTMIFPTAQGNGDIYVAKYNVSGTLVWVQRYGGTLSDRAYDLAIDNNGNILVTGAFAGTVDFGGHIVTSVGNTRDIFLLKMDNQGNVLWAISEGGSGVENAYGVTCDSQGNVILTGQFQGNTSIGGQTFNSKIDPTTNLPSFDLFISKYNSSGVFQWVKTGSAKYEDRGMSVTTDAQNDIYLTGQFSDTLVFAGQTFNNGTYNVGLLAKLSSNGNLKWFNTLRSSKVLPYSVKFDGENVLIAGDCGKNFTYSNNNSPYSQSGTYAKSIFLLKVAPNGAKVWLSTLGSDNDLSARALAVTSAREIYVTGYFACTWTEFHQPLSAFYNSVGFKDAYLWKADKNGNLKFVKTFGSKLDDVGNGVAILSGNTPVICGGNTGNLNIPTSSSSFYDVPTNDNFALRQYPNLGYNFVYLRGDKSLNSFLTTAVNDNVPAYNYFENQPNDSLFCEILPNGNPIHFCVKDSIWISAHTLRNVAPDYTYLWNTSETTERILVNTTGTYWANITREDGCSSGSDTLNVVIEQKPAFPLMSDSLGLAVNLPVPYYSYHFCYPDSVAIWFNNLSPNTTIKLKSGNQIYTDTLPHYYSKTVEVIITDSLCTSDTIIPIIMDYTSPSTYNPYLTLVDKIDYNDSISVCSGTLVGIENHDWNNNPNDSLGLYPDVHYVTNTWKAFLNNTLVASSTKMHGAGEQFHDIGYYFDFKPLQTGNYVIQLDAIIGYDNLCGLDTTHYTVIDTFYIEVLSNPAIPPLAISGDNMLCPNGSLYLSLDTTVAGFAWEGPAIQWQSVTKDTIQITKAGTYTYSGSFVDTTSGCKTQGSAQHIVYEKQPPIIQMYPADGVVCPYDSVTMWVDTIYQSYNWTSPQASNVSNVFYHKDELLGFYYVTVIDDEGCELTSPMAEIKEFTTPYLYVEPENVICQGQSTTIKVQMDGEGYINWLNPVSGGSNSQVVVTEAGWYYCELSQCGITTIDSIQILDGSFTISLNIGDTTICSSETVVLIAPSGYSSYEWSNGEEGISTIAVEDAGAYSVTVENDHGCKATSPAAKITTVSNEPPNDITDIHLCNEGNTVITSTQAVVWYDTDKNIIGNGTSIYVSAQSDTTFLYSFSAVGNCPIVYKSVSVHIAEPLPLFQVFGDTTLRFGQD